MVLDATRAVVQYAIKSVLDPTLPPNSGFTRAVEIIAPPGTIANSAPPGATMNRSDTAQRFVDVLYGALAKAVPDRVPAASNGAICGCQFFGPGRSGDYYAYLETIGGGMGARPTKDGLDGVQTHMSNTSNLPVEALETEYPLRVERYELIPDSGGMGTYRGGLGLRREYRGPRRGQPPPHQRRAPSLGTLGPRRRRARPAGAPPYRRRRPGARRPQQGV
jgi:N-methylhydantoinase B